MPLEVLLRTVLMPRLIENIEMVQPLAIGSDLMGTFNAMEAVSVVAVVYMLGALQGTSEAYFRFILVHSIQRGLPLDEL